jgi:hypothetical protein
MGIAVGAGLCACPGRTRPECMVWADTGVRPYLTRLTFAARIREQITYARSRVIMLVSELAMSYAGLLLIAKTGG